MYIYKVYYNLYLCRGPVVKIWFGIQTILGSNPTTDSNTKGNFSNTFFLNTVSAPHFG